MFYSRRNKQSLELKLEKGHQEVRYWQDCYETLLQQHFEDDRRGDDGTHKRVDQLVQYYKGEITDNALLNKAGRLAAESHLILRDKSIPDSIAIKKIKPLARQRGRLTKRITQIGPLSSNSGDVIEEEEEEEGD